MMCDGTAVLTAIDSASGVASAIAVARIVGTEVAAQYIYAKTNTREWVKPTPVLFHSHITLF